MATLSSLDRGDTGRDGLTAGLNTQHSARSAKEFNISSARNVAPLPFPAQGNKNNDVY